MKLKKKKIIFLFIFAILSSPFWLIGSFIQFAYQGVGDGYIMTKAFMKWIGK